MTTISKVKNPCKICSKSVKHKTGLQCQGACQKWVHFTCLALTPGKVKDIRAGIVAITCPCPDCKSAETPDHTTTSSYANTNCTATRPFGLNTRSSNQKFIQTSHNNIHPIMKRRSFEIQALSRVSSHQATEASLSSRSFPSGHRYVGGDTPSGLTMPSMSEVERMCDTVEELTNQINDLMFKMKQMVKEKNSPGCSGKSRSNSCERNASRPVRVCPKSSTNSCQRIAPK